MHIDSTVLDVLSRSQMQAQYLTLPEQLERKLYLRTMKVLEALGAQWSRKLKAHIFPGTAAEILEPILSTGSVTIAKDEFDFFRTPPELVARLISAAGVGSCMRVLEPSAGDGAIARELLEIPGVQVDCVELLTANALALRGIGNLSVRELDFLTMHPARAYDRVVMNPPFAKRQDVLHVLHALSFLKPGGRLAAIMSAGVRFRADSLTRGFRDLVEVRGGSIEDLPAGSFKASGTDVHTCLVVIPSTEQALFELTHPE